MLPDTESKQSLSLLHTHTHTHAHVHLQGSALVTPPLVDERERWMVALTLTSPDITSASSGTVTSVHFTDMAAGGTRVSTSLFHLDPLGGGSCGADLTKEGASHSVTSISCSLV